jgi:hypothetical protein
MTTAELIAAIRRSKGPLYVRVFTPDDVLHIKAVKADVIDALQTYDDDAPAVWEISIDGDANYLA